MGIVSTYRKIYTDLSDKISMKLLKKYETNKFKDPRRVSIFESYQLNHAQQKEIDSLYLKHYGEKIPYIWHKHFSAYTNHFDPNYIPELIYIPEFERFMNLYPQYTSAFEDKNVLPLLAENANVKMPNTIISCTKGVLRNQDNRFINLTEAKQILKDIGTVFIKPTLDSSSGRGCSLLNIKNGIDLLSNQDIDTVLSSLGRDYVIQERIVCHESISTIYPKSVNTFCVITYRWKDQILFMPAIMRIGQGGNTLDNAHAGGMFIAIDNDGTLHNTAFTEFKNEFKNHPDTNIKFDGYQIPLFSKVIESAQKMHELMPQIGVINWDFTINDNGEPVLIEANLRNGSIWFIQMSHGKGIFGEKTAEVLQWMKQMKKCKATERYKYEFGKMP